MNTDEVIERINVVLQLMSGRDLADLANKEFGMNLEYIGNDEFEEVLENVDNIPKEVSVNWPVGPAKHLSKG